MITQLMPATVVSGGSDFTLTVDGNNFATNAVVEVNGNAQPTMFASATELTSQIPASVVASQSTVKITVTNPGAASTGIYGGGTMSETSAAVSLVVN